MLIVRLIVIVASSFLLVACTTAPATHVPGKDLGLLWVNHAAEYRAITLQVYQSATDALPQFIENKSWSAQPGQEDAGHLPPAVVLDVDETVISNAKFQVAFERPMEQWKLERWNDEHISEPVPGVVEFVTAAKAAGVDVFFVSNRPCAQAEGNPDPCPQKRSAVRDIGELGIDTDAAHVLLAGEHGWDRAKIGRREHIAKTHRIIMLVGDDLGDFVPCVRRKLYGPCAQAATAASRRQLVDDHRHLWGKGWYILPGPMHGSWTSFK